jgi:hypothetical protein
MQLSPFFCYCLLLGWSKLCQVLRNCSKVTLSQTHCKYLCFDIDHRCDADISLWKCSSFCINTVACYGSDWGVWVCRTDALWNGCSKTHKTFWLPVKDNWNRGTKTEVGDKRKSKGRTKPVTVRWVLTRTAWKVLLWVQNPTTARKYLYIHLCLYCPV